MVKMKSVVDALRRAGFKCRQKVRYYRAYKERQRDVYVCIREDTEPVEVSKDWIEVRVAGTASDSVYVSNYDDIMREIESITGGKAYVDYSPVKDVELVIRFPLDEYKKAVRVAKAFRDRELYLKLAGLEGELRTMKSGKGDIDEEEWFDELERALK